MKKLDQENALETLPSMLRPLMAALGVLLVLTFFVGGLYHRAFDGTLS